MPLSLFAHVRTPCKAAQRVSPMRRRNPASPTSKRCRSRNGVTGLFSVTLLVLTSVLSPRAVAAEFEVGAGYLSASVRQIVEGYGWSLVWVADEDRFIDHPFTVNNGSLREALNDLLAIYRGQLVADLYEGNRVVLIDAAPPRVRVVLPGEEPENDPVAVGRIQGETALALAEALAEGERDPPAVEETTVADVGELVAPNDPPIGLADLPGSADARD